MNKIYYIVYDPITLKIIHCYYIWDYRISNYLKENPHYNWLNVTHPATKKLLYKINETNKTNY